MLVPFAGDGSFSVVVTKLSKINRTREKGGAVAGINSRACMKNGIDGSTALMGELWEAQVGGTTCTIAESARIQDSC